MHSILRFVSLFGLMFASIATASAAADVKIAVVDLQRALHTVEEGKKAKTQLEKELTAKQKQLQAEEESLKKMGEELKKQSLVLSDDAKARKQSELQERFMKYREMFGKSQMEIQQRERALTEPIINKLKGVVEELGNSKGYTIILEKSENGVLFSKSQDDLTEEVIKLFNKKNG